MIQRTELNAKTAKTAKVGRREWRMARISRMEEFIRLAFGGVAWVNRDGSL
jgi:hypothetical protein